MRYRKEALFTHRLTHLSALLGVLVLLAACSHLSGSERSHRADSDPYERSTLHLTRPPSQAGACIVEHARGSGRAAELVPLYGMESVAVTVKTSAAGDVLAVLSLTRSDDGTVAATTTWAGNLPDRSAFLTSLVQGC